MLVNLMIAVMATGMAGGASCADDFQSARAINVDPIELSTNNRSNAGIRSVEVLATVGADGRISQVATLGTAVPGQLERAVASASSSWTFEPAQACGDAVAQQVVFELPVLATRFSKLQNIRAPGPTNDPRGEYEPREVRRSWDIY